MEIIPSVLTAWVTKTVKSSRSQCFKTANAFRAIVVTTGGSNVDDASAHKRSPSLCRKAVFLQETREKALAKLLTSIVSNSSRLCSTKCCAKSSKLSEPHLEGRHGFIDHSEIAKKQKARLSRKSIKMAQTYRFLML